MKNTYIFLLIICSFSLLSYQNKLSHPIKETCIINELIIEIDMASEMSSMSKKGASQQALHKVFFDYFVENAMNRNKKFPKFSDKIMIYKNLKIPKQLSQNLTSEIENYGMEFCREFTKRGYFKAISYEVKENNVLQIYIQ